MNKHLQQLVDLSKIDKEIDSFEPKIEEATHKYETVLATKESIEKQISTLEEEIQAVQETQCMGRLACLPLCNESQAYLFF